MKTRYLRLVKKQRGFTLIELLAVILILGIIALIAIPTVSSVVEESRKGAAESSASQFVTSIGELIMTTDLQGTRLPDGLYSSEQLQDKGLNIKGTMPDDGYVLIEDGEVVGCNLNYGNYNVTCDGSDFNSSKKEETPKFTIEDDADSNGEVSLKDKVCIGIGEEKECFYVVGFDSDGNVRMLTEWNLNVGYDVSYNGSYELSLDLFEEYNENSYNEIIFFDEEKGSYLSMLDYIKINTKVSEIKQDEERFGYIYDVDNEIISYRGVSKFTSISKSNYEKAIYNGYWVDNNKKILSKYKNSYPSYVYDNNSTIYNYINNYANNIKIKYGQNIVKANLLEYEELIGLGCSNLDYTCHSAPEWVYQTAYWTGSASDYFNIYYVSKFGFFLADIGYFNLAVGVRPVITIEKSQISF